MLAQTIRSRPRSWLRQLAHIHSSNDIGSGRDLPWFKSKAIRGKNRGLSPIVANEQQPLMRPQPIQIRCRYLGNVVYLLISVSHSDYRCFSVRFGSAKDRWHSHFPFPERIENSAMIAPRFSACHRQSPSRIQRTPPPFHVCNSG